MTDKTHKSEVAFIQALAELLRENDLTELRVKREYGESDSLDVRVSRGGAPVVMSTPAQLPAPVAAAAAPREFAKSDDPSTFPGAVTSPMVGTAYLSSEPGADVFVKIGDTVQEGQTLMIIEAMKTMNQIPSPRSGTVKRIVVEDGSPVEFGAPLMIIE
ncbi:acetyl-CoA carboxylase biotin carboxyl carrier protein [Oceaniovalibus sp. ACAM 378]|uniref:acetyl-CoA carboxylase biotin carboxyl carrier protein n=1 Tax=Oceaniovalibus sp. ACAM 378 TaxID=2599923 RepID=UPI0011D803CF|nr:acetyl-CoA carboxylase biotin carboxyl carrier protein [Oceaniovalibus sp. ACAM 378]TYB91080.1 acetyl-CoA carboxylase biotin carboxyl carrier protein [Oceaniovalibus sp. ACAM 378]